MSIRSNSPPNHQRLQPEYNAKQLDYDNKQLDYNNQRLDYTNQQLDYNNKQLNYSNQQDYDQHQLDYNNQQRIDYSNRYKNDRIVATMHKSVTIVSAQRSNSLDYLNFEEKRQLIASSLSLSELLHCGPVVAAKEVAANTVIGELVCLKAKCEIISAIWKCIQEYHKTNFHMQKQN